VDFGCIIVRGKSTGWIYGRVLVERRQNSAVGIMAAMLAIAGRIMTKGSG